MRKFTVATPWPTWSLAEPVRLWAEFTSTALVAPILQRAPRGDGHPVLVLPGFVAGDQQTLVLRSYLQTLGYDTYAWELGRNLGPRSIGENGTLLTDRIDAIARATGRKISLIGWSLGGLMARQAIHERPGAIRQLIALGSPIKGNPQATRGWALYEWLSGHSLSSSEIRREMTRLRRPLPVPSTAIFSRTDGVTNWRNCVQREGPMTENIEVRGSHWGLVVNATALYAIADRLAQPEGEWQPFHRSGWLAAFYPASDFNPRSTASHKA